MAHAPPTSLGLPVMWEHVADAGSDAEVSGLRIQGERLVSKALKGKMPRLFTDHRSTPSRQLRAVYDELRERFPLNDGVARRMAVMTARAWLEYQTISAELSAVTARKNGRARTLTIIARLRRRQAAYAGQYLGGIRALATLTTNPTSREAFNLFEELARQEGGA